MMKSISNLNVDVKTNYGFFWEKYRARWEKDQKSLEKQFSKEIEQVLWPKKDPTDVPVFYIQKKSIRSVCLFLKEKLKYGFLADLTATDEMPRQPRFDLVLQLLSWEDFSRIRIKIKVPEGKSVSSLIPIWKGAEWAEREVYDMFGIEFEEHPDLRRILMDERWEGFPLRKDYPIKGHQVVVSPEAPHGELVT